MNEYVFEATTDNFETEVIKHPGAVLVDFWAEWCGPCKALGPVLDSLAEEYREKVKVVKVNVDHHPETAQQYKVRGIPTLVFFKNGEQAHQMVGLQSKDAIKAVIDKLAN
jgi:thioredoxin 1